MVTKYKFTLEGKKALGYVLVGAIANGVIDPLLGNWTYNNPNVPKSPLEPYITLGDGIQLAMNAGVFLAGYFTNKEPLVWVGVGMLGEKIGMKITVWIWNYLHPGYPVWSLGATQPTASAQVSGQNKRGTITPVTTSVVTSKYRITA